MAKTKAQSEKPLTLSGLVKYHEQVLWPAITKYFASKEELNDLRNDVNSLRNGLMAEMQKLRQDLEQLKNEFYEFRQETQQNFDHVFKELDKLNTERIVRQYQIGKERKWRQILIDILQKKKLLTTYEVKRLEQLEVAA